MRAPLIALALLAGAPAAAQELKPGLSVAWESQSERFTTRSTSTVTAVEPGGGFRFRFVLDRGGARTGVLDQRVSPRDVASATVYKARHTSRDTLNNPGTTSMLLSRALFADLKAGKTIRFTMLTGERSEGTVTPGRREAVTLKREPGAAQFETILDGEGTRLPAIVATGTADGKPARMTLLDDPAFPLVLANEAGGWGGRAVRIVSGN